MTIDIRNELRALVAVEYRAAAEALANPEILIPVMQCAKEYDLITAAEHTVDGVLVEDSRALQETHFLMNYGFPVLVRLFLEHCRPPPVDGLGFVADQELAQLARRMMVTLGIAGFVERSLDLVDAGLISLEIRDGDPVFVYDRRHFDAADHLIETAVRQAEHDILFETMRPRLENLEDDVRAEVSASVRLFHGRLPAYESTPLLDDHFMVRAVLWTKRMFENDAFAHTDRFGGIPYGAFALAITAQLMFRLKHELCIEVLSDREPDLSVNDSITITVSREMSLWSLRRCFDDFSHMMLGVRDYVPSDEDLVAILETISVNSRNATSLLNRENGVPPLIEFTPGAFIRSRRGAYGNPFYHLRRNLARDHQKDYSRAQAKREGRQLDMLQDFLPRFPSLQMRRNVKIRRAGRVLTDIDGLFLDLDANLLSFVQLKHQDGYGMNVGTRRDRLEKLSAEIRQWVDMVAVWSRGTDLVRFARDAGFKVRRSTESLHLRLLVVSAHHAHVLKDVRAEADFRYATWHEFMLQLGRAATFDEAVSACRLASDGDPDGGWDLPDVPGLVKLGPYSIRSDVSGLMPG